MKGHLIHFLYCNKFPSFWLLDRSLVDVSISPHLLTSYVIMFILVLKQPSFGTLILLDSKEDSLGSPRSFLDLRFDQHSYLLLSRDIRQRPEKGYATSPNRIIFASQHSCSLEGLKCCSLWHILEDVSVYYRFDAWRGQWPMGCKRAIRLSFWCVVWLPLDIFKCRISLLGTRDQDH